MDRTDYYALGTRGRRTTLHVAPCDPTLNEQAIHTGRNRPTAPIRFRSVKGASGSTICDLISTSSIPLVLMSDRAVSVLQEFTGWSVFPVVVEDSQGRLIQGYHGLVVTGRAGPIDDSRSELREAPAPVPGGRRTKRWFGIFFDETTWDGSDLFVPEGTALTVTVERVKRAFEKAKLTNANFRPLAEIQNTNLPSDVV